MCGIIGVVGVSKAVPLLLEGLHRLEYRGYDSAGVCVPKQGRLTVVKRPGRIAELEKIPGLEDLHSSMGIAHTRWATHGEPTHDNAHPHLDAAEQLAIVHNGIIENHHALRHLLEGDGVRMRSQTDSEVLAHLIARFYRGDLTSAVAQALTLVQGAYGLVVMHQDHSYLVAARKGSPLLIGVGAQEHYVASDASAILAHTNKVVYLEDGQIAQIAKDRCDIKKRNGDRVNATIHELLWTVDEIEKGGFKHFMLKEIFGQPDAIRNTLRGRITGGKIKLTIDVDLDSIRRILIVACGTSWHASLIGKYLIERIAGIPVEVDYASEFRYRDPVISERDLLIAISQSGETADTLAAIKEAKRKGAKIMGIVNVVGSTIARGVDSGIFLHAGPEIGVASTKAFTCQITALVLFASYVRQRQGKTPLTGLLEELEKVPSYMSQVLEQCDRIRELAKQYQYASNMLYLGRGVQFPAALEGALKLKEISYIHAEGYPAAEMKHGPIALIDENMPVVCIAPHDETYEKILSNMQEIRARKGNIISVVTTDDPQVRELSQVVIQVPQTHELLQPLVTSVPLQLFAYHIADVKGLNVDKPRNLAKSVTVE
ncbi:glutamine--fructose-6-phosphate transaminase (isomerizing) [Candidatus Woesearchaeota archaeon]|nr:glutamine--fructose-6-phosphate transaminase (isomerizing) [Candidatus Woesearchaeota archaeon]